jgi:hypothetical protein
MIYREMREYGTCLICLDQHISKLSDTVKGNSACHIAFQQQLPQDVYDVSSIMQLGDKKEIFSQLPVGFAVVKLSERYTSPFLIKVPYTDLRDSTISDERISAKMECVIQGIEVEKDDLEFKKDLTGNRKSITMKNVPETEIKISIETPRISAKTPIKLTKTQEILYEFVYKQILQGKSVKEAEKMLEKGLSKSLYKESDIFLIINHILEKEMNKINLNSISPKKQKIFENEIKSAQENEIKSTNLTLNSQEEENFINFLLNNPSHKDSTVEIYKKIGISSRKGNVLKNKLLSNGIIEVHEEKNPKGWKKIIKLNPKIIFTK